MRPSDPDHSTCQPVEPIAVNGGTPSALVFAFAFSMLSVFSPIDVHLRRVVIAAADAALHPMGVPRFIQSSLTSVQQQVVPLVVADEEVALFIVRRVAVNMVDDGLLGKCFSQRAFSNQDVFPDVTVRGCSGIIWSFDVDISGRRCKAATLPVGVQRSACVVAFDEAWLPIFRIARNDLTAITFAVVQRRLRKAKSPRWCGTQSNSQSRVRGHTHYP